MKNHKPIGDEEYTFVEERIVTKQDRARKVLTKILLDLLVPVCVCLLVCYIYVNIIGDDDEDTPIEPEVTTTENSIVVNGDDDGDKPPVGGNQDIDLNKDENLIKLEENIKKMVVVVSVVRNKTEAEEDGKDDFVATDNNDISKHTGVIVSMNGPVYILMPYESIRGYKELYTHIGNEPALATTVYDIDYATGLALLKIEDSKITGTYRKQMTVATFEGINQVESGSAIVYCGSVVGNTPMFMKGRISNSGNHIPCIDMTYNLLITDIVMENENDGFLFNSKGNLVGIVGLSSGDIEVPAFIAAARAFDLEYIINNMLNDKKDIYFGITGQQVSVEIEAIAGGNMPNGIYVSNVIIDSPAYNAGILAGDIIFRIDGMYEPDMDQYRNYIERKEKGDTIKVQVKRKIGTAYNVYTMTVTLNSRD